MFNINRKEIQWAGRTLSLETGKIARQADGCVIVKYGETTVMATAVASKKPNPHAGFFPLTVQYQEKFYAAGKIPGGYFKREGRPTERETLISRLIDRPIRPLFPDEFRNETQIICTVLSYDPDCDPDVVSIIAASAALTISGIPFMGPIGAAKIGYVDGRFTLNPSLVQLKDSALELIMAATSEGVLMVESQAKELSEETMLKAVEFGHQEIKKIIETIISLAEDCAKDPWELPEPSETLQTIKERLKSEYEPLLREAYGIREKQARSTKLTTLSAEAVTSLTADELDESIIKEQLKKLESDIVRGDLLKTGKRIDGRDTKTIRPIATEVNVLPRVHGSALFTRGETQALVITTLGTGRDEQMVDSLEAEMTKERFMLHYNFPHFSVGEVGRLGSTSRREIGHGKLAWRAIAPVLPTVEDFPYTLRIVSEVTESNGSSSMATVCGSSLSPMAAGVPLSRPVAGIAMGLIKDGSDFTVLSDILGDEDHLGDMDFKVAGTDNGITALQMDIKITSITGEIMEIALKQAKEGRLHILAEMAKTLTKPHSSVGEYAPKIVKIKIPTDKIGEVIGPGGSNIKKIIEKAGATIDISEDGTTAIGAISQQSLDMAKSMIEGVFIEPDIGAVYEGKVVGITDFGAFVNFLGSRDGLVHISELANHRVEKVSDVLKLDDVVRVKCIGVDQRGKIKLSIKALQGDNKDSEIHATDIEQA